MRGTDIVCSQHTPFRIEPRFGQVSEYGRKVEVGDGLGLIQKESPARLAHTRPEPLRLPSVDQATLKALPPMQRFTAVQASVLTSTEKPWDVLEEGKTRITLAKDANSLGPHIAGVFFAFALARLRERLAGEASGDDVARSGDGVEVADVGVDGEAFTACASTVPAPLPFWCVSFNRSRRARYESWS
jgi:hypothetical protein